MYHMAYVSGDNFEGMGSFLHVGVGAVKVVGNKTLVVKLGSKCLKPLSHLFVLFF